MRMARFSAALLGIALLAAACGSTDANETAGTVGPAAAEEISTAETSTGTPDLYDGPTALQDRAASGQPALIDPGLITSGGPPPDGIPPVDEPRFVNAAEVDNLEPDEAVLALEVNGDSRAYPIRIMTWHELVNDEVGGVPVTVSYCPLCNSALVYEREVDDQLLDFGTSGMLYQSSLVMYDRQTESLWTHFDGRAVVGELVGTELETIPVTTVAWAAWLAANPDGMVLSEDTGFSRPYGSNPYVGYEGGEGLLSPGFQSAEFDPRLPAKERVIGIRTDDNALAVLNSGLLEVGVVEVTLDGAELVVWSLPGTSSALDKAEVSGGVDVGAVGVFVPQAGDQRLTFERVSGGFVDEETGSLWNVFGLAVEGALAGEQLEAVEHVDSFWFVWGTFAPGSEIVSVPVSSVS